MRLIVLIVLLFSSICSYAQLTIGNNGTINIGPSGSGSGGVSSINGTTGAFTFTGSAVSCVGTICTFTGGGGGMVYPSAGVAVSTGSAWGTSLQVGTSGAAIPLLSTQNTWSTHQYTNGMLQANGVGPANDNTDGTKILYTSGYGWLASGASDALCFGNGQLTAGGLPSTQFGCFDLNGNFTLSAPLRTSVTGGVLDFGTLSYSDSNTIEAFQGSVNAYLQNVLQNTNTGSTASADFVVANSNTTATTYYGDFGMNGSGFAGSGAFNQPNNVFLTSTSSDLVIGTTTTNAIHFVVNNGATDSATVNGTTGIWTFTTTPTGLATSGSNSNITSLTGLSTPLSTAQGGTGAGVLTGYRYANGAGADTASTTIPLSAISAAASGSGTYDFSGATQLKMPVTAGYASLANGEMGYDSTNLNWHIWVNGADTINAVMPAAGIVSGNCVKALKTSNTYTLADSGGACGSSTLAFPVTVSSGGTAWTIPYVGSGGTTLADQASGPTVNNGPLLGQTAAAPTWSGIAYPSSAAIGGLCYGTSSSAIACGSTMTSNALVKMTGTAPASSTVLDNGTVVFSSEPIFGANVNQINGGTAAYTNANTSLAAFSTAFGFKTTYVTTGANYTGTCHIVWQISALTTSPTIQFGINTTGAPAHMVLSSMTYMGTSILAPFVTTSDITTATTTAATASITPAAATTNYFTDITVTLATTSATGVTVNLYGLTTVAGDVLSIQPGTSCKW